MASPNEALASSDNANDVVIQAAGPWGRWQARQAVLLALLKLPIAWFQLSTLFLAPKHPHWCGEATSGLEAPVIEAVPNVDECHSFNWDASVAEPCNHWEYNRTVFQETIVSEWDLVCGKSDLTSVAQMVLMFGVLVGNIIFGAAADRWGRRTPLLVAIVVQAVMGVITAFAPFLSVFMILRFLVAVATGGTMVVSFVICMEVVGGPWRTVVPILYQIPFSLGVFFMAGVAYYLRSWRDLQLALGLCSVPFVLYYWLIPESPRWLLAVGRDQEAIAILEEAARMNGMAEVNVKALLLQSRAARAAAGRLPRDQGAAAPVISGLLRTPRLRRMTLCLFVTWFVTGLVFFGFSEFQGQMGGDIFVNVAISGLISVPGPVLCAALVRVLGRRAVVLGSLITSSAATLLILVVPPGVLWGRPLLAGISFLGLSVTFAALYLYSGELLPTVVRNVGMGASSMCARVGSMLAPFVVSQRVHGDSVPLLVLGLLPLVGAALLFPLPETMDCVLPESLQDGENFCRRRAKEDLQNSNYIQVPLKDVTLTEEG
ncbi:organic cation transporter protein-like [Frankliniella occidentalis]|uniref:Organic cation transporter protein-like n=1 Tax=Frankliniella occidentalis TaxID=133901 RepID=A0A6J1SN53_FRAOC|nr:organic cation transporter protein-like [Frankliniella occidentalis]